VDGADANASVGKWDLAKVGGGAKPYHLRLIGIQLKTLSSTPSNDGRWCSLRVLRRSVGHQSVSRALGLAYHQRTDGIATFPAEGRRPRRTPETSSDRGRILEGLQTVK